MDGEIKAFYEEEWFMWLMLFLFFPLGLFLMWYYKHHSMLMRMVVTFICISIMMMMISIFTSVINSNRQQGNDKGVIKSDQNAEKIAKQKIEEKAKIKAEQGKKEREEVIMFARSLEGQLGEAVSIDHDRMAQGEIVKKIFEIGNGKKFEGRMPSTYEMSERFSKIALRWSFLEKQEKDIYIPTNINNQDKEIIRKIVDDWADSMRENQIAVAYFEKIFSGEAVKYYGKKGEALLEEQQFHFNKATQKLDEAMGAERNLLKKYNITVEELQ